MHRWSQVMEWWTLLGVVARKVGTLVGEGGYGKSTGMVCEGDVHGTAAQTVEKIGFKRSHLGCGSCTTFKASLGFLE